MLAYVKPPATWSLHRDAASRPTRFSMSSFRSAIASTADMGGQSRTDWVQPVLVFDLGGFGRTGFPRCGRRSCGLIVSGGSVIPWVISR